MRTLTEPNDLVGLEEIEDGRNGVHGHGVRRASLRVTVDGKDDTRRHDDDNPSSHRGIRHLGRCSGNAVAPIP